MITYSASGIDLGKYKFSGRATVHEGRRPPVQLDHYPLLAWTHLGHEKHGNDVFTEDQRASVVEIARALTETPDFKALAEKFGTTEAHVVQAVDYAIEAGVIAPAAR